MGRDRLLGFALALGVVLTPGCASLLCRSGPVQQELRALESEFHTLQGNLARGYAIHVRHDYRSEPYTETETRCSAHDIYGKCTLFESRTVTKYRQVPHRIEEPVAIDMSSTRERVSLLNGRINALRTPAAQEYQACMARSG